jgi:hypothetical protein
MTKNQITITKERNNYQDTHYNNQSIKRMTNGQIASPFGQLLFGHWSIIFKKG